MRPGSTSHSGARRAKHSILPLTYKPTPVRGGVAAYTISQSGGTWQFVPKWLSEDINAGEEALIANDIVFTYGSVKTHIRRRSNRHGTSPRSSVIVLRSPRTRRFMRSMRRPEKRLWSSGEQITSFNHFSGITVANGRIYLGTYDGTMWCFGIAK